MTPGSTWIERGADGRPYYVKKKSKLPSARELLSDALAPLRKSSSPFSRAYQRDHHIVPAPSNAPLYLTAPNQPPSNFTATPNIPPHIRPSSRTGATIMDYTQYPHFSHGSRDSDSDNPRGILKPRPQTYPVPHPHMYPVPPQNIMPLQQHSGMLPPPLQNHVPFHLQHIPTQPPGAYSSQPLPPGARVISPPRYPTADELKYKCSICGRFRSARYHYKHPIPPGQLPAKTVCRKCQDEATDSEDSSSSSDHRRDIRRRCQRSRSRSRVTAVPARRRSKSRRGRRMSRAAWSDEEYEDELRDRGRSYSRSSSLEVQPRRRRTRFRYSRSPSVEVLRYIEGPPRPQPRRQIVYVENERPRREEEYFYDEASEDFEYRPAHRYTGWMTLHKTVANSGRIRRISRPPTPAPRVIRYRSSDPAIRTPLALDQRGYFDDLGSSLDDYDLDARPSSRATSRSRLSADDRQRRQTREYASESDDDFYDNVRRDSYRRPRSLIDRGRSANRSSSRAQGESDGVACSGTRNANKYRRSR